MKDLRGTSGLCHKVRDSQAGISGQPHGIATKGQAPAFNVTGDIDGEARIVERAFGLGASVLAEVANLATRQLGLEAAWQDDRSWSPLTKLNPVLGILPHSASAWIERSFPAGS